VRIIKKKLQIKWATMEELGGKKSLLLESQYKRVAAKALP